MFAYSTTGGGVNTQNGYRSDRELYNTAVNTQMEENAVDLLVQEEPEEDIKEVDSNDDNSMNNDKEENSECDFDDNSEDNNDKPIYESDKSSYN